jgi:hypothetical protein
MFEMLKSSQDRQTTGEAQSKRSNGLNAEEDGGK